MRNPQHAAAARELVWQAWLKRFQYPGLAHSLVQSARSWGELPDDAVEQQALEVEAHYVSKTTPRAA